MGVDEKEYKLLTLDQFKRIVKQLPEVRDQMKELPTIITHKSVI